MIDVYNFDEHVSVCLKIRTPQRMTQAYFNIIDLKTVLYNVI